MFIQIVLLWNNACDCVYDFMCHKYQFNINFSSLLHILQFVDAFRNAIAHQFMTVRFLGLQWKLDWRLVAADKLSISLTRWHDWFYVSKFTYEHDVSIQKNDVCQTFPNWIEILSIILEWKFLWINDEKLLNGIDRNPANSIQNECEVIQYPSGLNAIEISEVNWIWYDNELKIDQMHWNRRNFPHQQNKE